MRNLEPLLDIQNLRVDFAAKSGNVSVVDGLSLKIRQGERFCLIGESGCGKSIAALSILGLLPKNACITGRIGFNNMDITALGPGELRTIRGRQASMIFETPMSRLNPVFTVGNQIAEAARRQGLTRKQAKKAAIDLLARTGVPEPGKRARQFPWQFSGGMAQRAMIAMALAARPRLLIADEPTTALDPTVQMQIIELILDVTKELGASLFLITHDLDVASELCGTAGVMYAGQMMETGKLDEIMRTPRHPYSMALMETFGRDEIRPIRGTPPLLSDPPSGCRFHPRCDFATDMCSQAKPCKKNGVSCFWES